MIFAGDELAELIVAFIQGQKFTVALEAIALDDPNQLDLEAKSPHPHTRALALPFANEITRVDRGSWRIQPVVTVFVSRFLTAGETRKKYQAVAAEIETAVREKVWLGAGDKWQHLTSAWTSPPYDNQLLQTQNRFMSGISFTFWDVQ